MNKIATKGLNTFNTVRSLSSKSFQELVPQATETNIASIANILLNDAYQPQLNEFITNLINRIGLTIVRNKSFNNPLAMFKKGSVPLGTDIQDIYTNPAEAEEYEYSNEAMAKLLTINDPDTHVAYYRRNRKDLYEKTIGLELLQGAFVSWEKFNEMVTSITNSLYSGNYIDEFRYTKLLVDGAYDNGKVIVETVSAVTNESTAKAFLKKCRALYNKISKPSTKYNAYSKFSGAKGEITTWTDPERIVVITTADVMAEVDVEALASAFNIDKADFIGRVVTVDEFENPQIQAVICDEAWLQIYDSVFTMKTFENGRTLSWKYMLHAWQTYAICPFANAVCLATEQAKPATAISMSTDNIIGAEVGDETTGTITLTPADSTSDYDYKSSNEAVATIEATSTPKTYKITATGLGNATLTAYTDTGKEANITISVTTLPAEEISFGADDVEVAVDETIILALTSDPEDANDSVSFTAPEGYTDYFTFSKIDNKHVSITGVQVTASDITLTATTSKGETATIDVSVVAGE